MRRRWPLIAALLLAPALLSAGERAPAEGQDVARAVEDHYRAATGITARVVQRNYLRSVDKTQTFEGNLFIKRPGRLRLEYTNGQMILIDGKEAWFYSRKNEQAIRRTFRDFEQASIPVAFLLGAQDIRAEFLVTRPEGEKPGTLDLAPRRKDGAVMKKIRLVADSSGRITEMTVYDPSGNSSNVVFSEVKEGVALEDTLFQFKAPKGTEIIEQ